MAEAMASKRAGEAIESSKGKRQRQEFDEPLGASMAATSNAGEVMRPPNGVLAKQEEAADAVEQEAQVVDGQVTDGDGVHDEEDEGGVYSDVEEEFEESEYSSEGDGSDDSDDDSLDDGRISTPPPDRKGKGIVLDENRKTKASIVKDVKGKGKAVLVEDDDSSDESDEEVVEDYDVEGQENLVEDPLLEVDLNNILPTRTRRRQQPPSRPPVVGDSDSSEEDEDYVAGGNAD